MKSSRVLLVILWLQLTWMRSQQKGVEQSPGSLSLREGDTASLNCNYSDSASQYFMWYRQYSGKGPELLMYLYSGGEKTEGRFSGQVDRAKQYVSLLIRDSQPSDSATYLCAVTGKTGSRDKLTFGTGTHLTVRPNITDPDPAVYQLRGPKSSKISVCLFTDFDSETSEQQAPESTMIRLNSTVLDMWSMNSKSNGALAWSTSTDFKCNETFNEEFYSSSDFSCNAILIEKSFETDMNLNFENLLVIGLRVILLKVAGFNLFMTLRLWSR